MIICGLFIAGCMGQPEQKGPSTTTPSSEPVVIGVGPWGTAYASSYVMKEVLEEAGYTVDLRFVDIGVAFQAVASENIDCYLDAWVPTCHEQYMDRYGDQFEVVRYNMEGTRIGMVVPSYVPIDSIGELEDYPDRFGKRIVSIEPGSGTARMSRSAVDVYGLDGWKVVTGSEVGMLTELRGAINAGEWIVITGWTPHWKFARWDLKYLDDPKQIYGGEEYIATITRSDLQKDRPGVYAILERFHWEPADMNEVMYAIEKGASNEQAAHQWVEENPDTVNKWLGRS